MGGTGPLLGTWLPYGLHRGNKGAMHLVNVPKALGALGALGAGEEALRPGSRGAELELGDACVRALGVDHPIPRVQFTVLTPDPDFQQDQRNGLHRSCEVPNPHTRDLRPHVKGRHRAGRPADSLTVCPNPKTGQRVPTEEG